MSETKTNCLIAPGFRADETRTIRLRYLPTYPTSLVYNVQVVDVATRIKNHKGFDNCVDAKQGTYAFSWDGLSLLFILDYLDKDSKWRDDNGYPRKTLIRDN
jgi:hypothetical protein